MKSFPSIVSIHEDVNETPCLLLSELDVVTTTAPLKVFVSIIFFLQIAATSGYSATLALLGDLIYNSGCTDGDDECNLPCSYNKMAKMNTPY